MFALDGGEHAVCPAKFTLALILDRGGADELDMGRQAKWSVTCLLSGGWFSLIATTADEERGKYCDDNVPFHVFMSCILSVIFFSIKSITLQRYDKKWDMDSCSTEKVLFA